MFQEVSRLENTDRISVAVVGAGGWGKNLIRVFSALPHADLKYICDMSEERLNAMQSLYQNETATTQFDTVLNDESIQTVVVATPADTHYRFIKESLQTGRLHVFTEKPLSLSSHEAAELVTLAEKTGLTLMVGHLLLYHPAVTMLKDLVDSGELGEIYCIYTNRLNLGEIRKVENAWWSLAPHDISILNYILDTTPVSISAQGQCFIQPGVEDIVFAVLNYPENTIAHVHVSWLDPHKMRKITIVGSKMMVVFDDMQAVEKIKIYDKGVIPAYPEYPGHSRTDPVVSYDDFFRIRTGDVHIPKINMEEPLKLECEHFLDSVINGTPPLSDGVSGLEVVRILAAGEESMKNGGKPVAIN